MAEAVLELTCKKKCNGLSMRREKFPIFLGPGLLFLGFALLLAVNWPGQMSYDSVVQLADGRSGQYGSWHPPVMAWLLGLFDSLLPGTGLFLLFTALLLFCAWLLLLRGTREGWGLPILMALLFATPQLLLYQGTIWKDVLFANAGILAFALLAKAAARWRDTAPRILLLLLCATALGLAALARQNGFLLLPIAAATLGWIARRQNASAWGHGLALLLASLAIMVGANFMLSFRGDNGEGRSEQIRLAQTYDLIAAVRLDSSIHLAVLEKQAPALNNAIRKDGVALYSPRLVDTLEQSGTLTQAIYHAPPGVVFAQWRQLILSHPGLYLRERWPVFRWVVAPPDLFVCHPDVVGVDGPKDMLKSLGLKAQIRPQDRLLYSYVANFFHTPVLSHLLYGAMAAGLAFLLARRGSAADMAIAGLQIAALAFAASFFVVSIACDYRYLYFLDLAAMTGLLQVFAGRARGRT
jgi:hypothetical protein